jgi:putative ABC transport system ATP-binding protein
MLERFRRTKDAADRAPQGASDRPRVQGAVQARPHQDRPPAKRKEPVIDLQGITKVYDTDAGPFVALKGIDLQVYPGEFVAVVGRSGSGKSTLINMFTGIDHPTDGNVIVAQTQIRRLNQGQMAQWRGRHLGIVFQFFQLLPTLTIVENVMLPMDLCHVYDPGDRPNRALHLLEQVGIGGDAHKFPAEVSGGHLQRAAIARALANDPPILVADEPTGNLDSKTARTIFRLFESLVAGGKTILMVTHDEELAGQVFRTLTLVDGELVDEVRHSPTHAGMVSALPPSLRPIDGVVALAGVQRMT